jgi:glycerol kinase
MSEDLGRPLSRMRVDGGAAENDLLLELQASFSHLSVDRPTELESTARGAAMLAGVGAGLFKSGAEAAAVWRLERSFDPALSAEDRKSARSRWLDAVRRARSPETG